MLLVSSGLCSFSSQPTSLDFRWASNISIPAFKAMEALKMLL